MDRNGIHGLRRSVPRSDSAGCVAHYDFVEGETIESVETERTNFQTCKWRSEQTTERRRDVTKTVAEGEADDAKYVSSQNKPETESHKTVADTSAGPIWAQHRREVLRRLH